MRTSISFEEAYKGLNKAQKEAVDSIDGPVLVVAGPGTGKTQVLALRIANILDKTDTPPDGVLCLTFTNSGVRAMRERLAGLIGPTASRVVISTFHSYGMGLIEEFYEFLGLPKAPTLIDDKDSVLLVDELLESHNWEYLRPRSGGAHNFKDLKAIISLLKREGISADDFLVEIERDIDAIKNDPENISSRGPSKGQLKKDAEERMERLARTKETAKFFELYEKTKAERNIADYDDVLEYVVRLVSESAEARDTIRERSLYVLVDEHQDSSGVQNRFLEAVWGGVEKPNVFAVGDDRQLIYGFGGASLSHFERFREIFSGTKIISLIENYRSTQTILDTADMLLESSLVKGKLTGNVKESHSVRLVEAQYPRDEILAAGIAIKKAVDAGLSPSQCAILVPKNSQAQNAVTVLTDLGLPVASGGKASFFGLRETQFMIAVLRALALPYDASRLAVILLDPLSGIAPLTAHKFLHEYSYKLSLDAFAKGEETIRALGGSLAELAEYPKTQNLYCLVQEIGERFFFKNPADHDALLRSIEIVRTMLHLVLSRSERDPKLTLAEFADFLERMESYGQDIPLAVFGSDEGVKVMTLHSSKGLEFDFVWIAHLDERSLMTGKRMGFTLPRMLEERVSKKDEITARRELYVAITRAKRFCTLSYARMGYTGGDLTVARIIADLPETALEKVSASETEAEVLAHDPKAYIAATPIESERDTLNEIKELVKENYAERKVAVTHLNNFYDCVWKWYFRNFLRLPEPETESLQFGNLIHHALEAVFKDRLSESAIPQLVEEGLDSLCVADERVRVRFAKDATKILTRFIRDILPDISKEARSEKEMLPYRDPDISDIEVTGKIDLVEELADGTVRVTDFKTGKPKPKREIEKRDNEGRMHDYLRQLSMYSYLLAHDKNKKEASSSRLLFLETNTDAKDAIYETHIESEHIESLRKDLSDYNNLLKSGEWTARPCNAKTYGTQKECEYCALAKRVI